MAVTSFDVEYVRNLNFPFIQLVKTGAEFQKETTVNFIQTSIGWVIHGYDEAVSASTALDINTDVSAKVGVVAEIANLIARKGWKAVDLVSGTQMMKRCIWIESKRYGFLLNDYIPTEDDKKCLEILIRHTKECNLAWEKYLPVIN